MSFHICEYILPNNSSCLKSYENISARFYYKEERTESRNQKPLYAQLFLCLF